MLKLDFYESGNGETILITFPSGGIGVVDAHPSSRGLRPPILDLVRGRHIHFVCLTHPHADHGVDLTSIGSQFTSRLGKFLNRPLCCSYGASGSV